MAHSEAFYKKPEECHYSFFQHKECEFFPLPVLLLPSLRPGR